MGKCESVISTFLCQLQGDSLTLFSQGLGFKLVLVLQAVIESGSVYAVSMPSYSVGGCTGISYIIYYVKLVVYPGTCWNPEPYNWVGCSSTCDWW